MLGVSSDPPADIASGASEMQGELGPVASGMSAGHSMMSGRGHGTGGHSSFMGGTSGTGYPMSPSHSLMGTPSMGGGASSMAGRTPSAMWQAERTSSGQATRKHMHTPTKHSSSSRHGHSGHHAHHVSGSSSQMRPRSSGQSRGRGGSAPIGHQVDRRRQGSSSRRHRTHAIGGHVQPHPQQRGRHPYHRSSRSQQQHHRRGPSKSSAEGKALLELDQALNALQTAVKPTKRPSQRKTRTSDPRLASRSRGSSRRYSSRSHPVQQPSVAEAQAKVLSAINSRLKAASALLANASKPRPKPKEKDGAEDGNVSDVPVLENDDGVLPISAADGCVEGPRAAPGGESDASGSASELSFTLPAQGAPVDPRATLQLAGFQWLYTADDSKSPEALRESIAVVQRQIQENPEIVAQAAAAAMDGGDIATSSTGGDGVNDATGGSPAEGSAEEDAEKKNAYAVVAALVATVRAEAAAEAERVQSDGYVSSDDGDEQLAEEDSQLHGADSEDDDASDAGSMAGSVMEFASVGGEDSLMFQREDSMDAVNLPPPTVYSGEDLLSMHATPVAEEDEDDSAHGEGQSSGADVRESK